MENPTDNVFIDAVNVTRQFQMGRLTVDALCGVNLQVKKNAFQIIMGPSGSGKSTLLYLIGGLDRPTAGEIKVDGELIDSLDENRLAIYRRQKVGFIFQTFNLLPSMSALENVAFPLRFARVSRRNRLKKAMDLLEIVGLADRANHKPSELSGGQQQRVAIARALVNDPVIILADEPTGNLDTAGGLSVMQALADLHSRGATMIVVTHDTRNRQFATQTNFILDGRIVPQEIYEHSLNNLAIEAVGSSPTPSENDVEGQ
jgi:putative ABC transport system ATP-binding protein